MPPRRPQRQARPRGYDPTVSISAASAARALNQEQDIQEVQQIEEPKQEQNVNDDLKKLIETLKNKMGASNNPIQQKKAPPQPASKISWNRSVSVKEPVWTAKPAYTILTRISNHEKVPVKVQKQAELTINSLPHSFLYKPGVDGIKIDKLSVKAGKQIGVG